MKNKIILTGFLILMVMACDEEFLTIPSESSLSTPVYFKTQADFESAVNGIYAPLREFYAWLGTGGSTTTASHLVIGDMHSDNARYYYNPNYRATTTAEQAADFVPDNQLFSSYWNNFYLWIARANQVLSLIDDANFDQLEKDNLKGQALFLRAFSYWWLARVYGSACIHLEPVTSVEEASVPLSPEADIINLVIDDVSSALNLLKDKATQEPGRVTKGSAGMLLADVYMWLKQWNNAEAQLTSLKQQYDLMQEYADVFNPANKNNQESIFEIQYDASSSAYANWTVYTMFPYPLSADSLQKLTGIVDPTALTEGEGFCIPTPDLINKYHPNDSRFTASIRYVHDANGVLLPMCSKYLHSHSLYRQSNENMPVYRYAEALLFLAEAINEQGGRSDEALGYLNEVRNRAGLEDSPAVTQEEIREAILNERQLELAFEGKRWFDLVRTNNVEAVIVSYGARVKSDPEDYYFTIGQAPVPSAFTNIATRFNLPDAEKLYNPFIE